DESVPGARALREMLRIEILGGDDALLRPVVSKVAGEGARVDPLNADDGLLPHVVVDLDPAAPVRRVGAGLLYDEAVDPGTARLPSRRSSPRGRRGHRRARAGRSSWRHRHGIG